MIVTLLILAIATGYVLFRAILSENPVLIVGYSLVLGLIVLMAKGFVMVQPNQAQVLQLFGNYAGSIKTPGLWWTNPFYTAKPVSLRVRNFETAELKVNDHSSNPIEIGAVVVWQVVDSAEAMFEVENYEDYVHVQSESALRALANQFPYDHHEGAISLSTHTAEIADKLRAEIHERLAKAGVKVLEARISHLAYAPEIANAMLRRQQASAIITARSMIVDGAVGMVHMALAELAKGGMIQLDEERKASMVSNLLVVLCSENSTQPVVNTGTLYN
jgi:regulator of protease activity HflC (stomatin/prohibitin superfamily)